MTDNRLQKILDKNSWTQSQLSEVSNVPIDTVRKIVAKEFLPNSNIQLALVEGLNKLAGREQFSRESVFLDIRGGGDGPS